jgi:hypothetical protein
MCDPTRSKERFRLEVSVPIRKGEPCAAADSVNGDCRCVAAIVIWYDIVGRRIVILVKKVSRLAPNRGF